MQSVHMHICIYEYINMCTSGMIACTIECNLWPVIYRWQASVSIFYSTCMQMTVNRPSLRSAIFPSIPARLFLRAIHVCTSATLCWRWGLIMHVYCCMCAGLQHERIPISRKLCTRLTLVPSFLQQWLIHSRSSKYCSTKILRGQCTMLAPK